MKEHRDGYLTSDPTLGSTSSGARSVPFHGRSLDGSATKERTPLPRTGLGYSLSRWRRTRRFFTADVSVFMAHLPGKPFRDVKFGTKSPNLLA